MEPEKVAWLDAPTIFDVVKTDRQRQVLSFFAANTMLGRPLMAPPDVPAERVALLRHAFDETMKDPAFLKEARGMGFEVSPQTGAQIAARVAESMNTPQSIIDEVAQASHLH
jgi:hypothetical protein